MQIFQQFSSRKSIHFSRQQRIFKDVVKYQCKYYQDDGKNKNIDESREGNICKSQLSIYQKWNKRLDNEQLNQYKKISKDLLELTKFKLSLLNSIGAYSMFYFYAPLQSVGILSSATFILATQAVAMSSQVFGQVNEAKFDALMKRTQNRPMVLGKFTSGQGCLVGTSLSVLSLIAFGQFQPYTFLISNAVWFSYLCVYLPMKQNSSQNTLIGAIVGALPPFIGTFAQTGVLFDIPTLLLSLYIFSWQFPHFYGILYENKEDYKNAGFVMISDEDPTGRKNAYKQMLCCNILNSIVPLIMALPSIGMIHPIVLAPFYAYQVQSFKAINEFYQQEASIKSAKFVKKSSYFPFMVLLTGFFGTTIYNRFEDRRLRDKEMIMQ